MAATDPEIKDLPVDEWTLLASGVSNGFIQIPMDGAESVYFSTHRITTEPVADPPSAELAPADEDFEGIPIYYRVDRIAGEFVPVGGATIQSTVPRDIYVYAWRSPGKIILTQGE